MKYIAFIVLGLVLLAAIAAIVLRANMPTAKLTVHAVRPMGTNASLQVGLSQEANCPIWEFAVTNQGGVSAICACSIRTKDTRSGVISFPYFYTTDSGSDTTPAESVDYHPFLKLPPGAGVTVYMPVSPDSNSLWAAGVNWTTTGSTLEEKLDSWLKPVPRMRRLLPNNGGGCAWDTWHTGTNVISEH